VSEDAAATLECPGLDKLVKAMGVSAPSIRVGVLGQKAARNENAEGQSEEKPKEGELNNAEIGAFHEFGTGNNPERSFLRVPISDNLEKYLDKNGALDEDVLKETIASGTLVPYALKVAATAEEIVADAFQTGGFGKWKPSNMAGKKVAQTLVETQQLRNSITSEVKESGSSE
jgi:phage gpG-like protein